jgi:hypothetical protein
MPAWFREPLARDHFASPIVVKPGFSWLEACRDRMLCRVKMLRGMSAGRTVATADVPAFRAAPEMQPPSLCSQALRAALAARRHIGIDSMMITFHSQFLFESILYGFNHVFEILRVLFGYEGDGFLSTPATTRKAARGARLSDSSSEDFWASTLTANVFATP